MLHFYKNRNLLLFLLMLCLVPLAGEPKIHPFSGELSSFRVSFGSPIFLLFLLWIRKISFIKSGFFVGLSVVIFRISLDIFLYELPFEQSLILRGPTFFYYFVYASVFRLPNSATLYNKALQIAGWSILAEFAASIAELMVANICSGFTMQITCMVLLQIIFIAIIRCFFILSFFYIAQLYHAESKLIHEKNQNEHMLLLISNLYEEMIQMSKLQQNAETITRTCYALYERVQTSLTPIDKDILSQELLHLAGQVHEIKKDNQRIYAGLQELTHHRKLADYIAANELCDLIITSNQKYAKSLQKQIDFSWYIAPNLPCLHAYTILSLVNNLVANAIEAIKTTGFIHVAFKKQENYLTIHVADSGVGIPDNKKELLFQPGYTTKFSADGKPSTGVGLPFVKHLTTTLEGTIAVGKDEDNRTLFVLNLPLKNLKG